jgi:N6-adenosine-specific RNA methylase IME4/ParB-like chromosome segregation protein Spo0J
MMTRGRVGHDVKARVVELGSVAILPDRMRELRPEIVDQLAESIRTQGLLHPIILRPRPRAAGYLLIAGRHRLEAMRKLNRLDAEQFPDSIRAEIRDGIAADQALLAEIDENLIRADLSPAERALHVGRRKELYEALHPETKQGKAPGKAGGGKKAKPANLATFAKETAGKTGQSRRNIERDATRAKQVEVLGQIVGTCLDKGDEIDALAGLPPDRQQALAGRAKGGEKVSAKTEVKRLKRDERERELAGKQAALPSKRYGVIVADPEWRFEPWSRTTGMNRAADNHYPTSCLEAIKARDVGSIAAADCVLFLWATIPMLPHALLVMAAWGFDYKSHYAWGKDKEGTGYWSREKHELLLIGTRGEIPCPAPGDQLPSLITAPRSEHSAKPECFLEMIERYFPTLPKIELNRRGPPRPRWDAWGYEVAERE